MLRNEEKQEPDVGCYFFNELLAARLRWRSLSTAPNTLVPNKTAVVLSLDNYDECRYLFLPLNLNWENAKGSNHG